MIIDLTLFALQIAAAETGSSLRTFRLAVSTTGEYTQARNITTNGDSLVVDVLNSVIAEINNVNFLFEAEFLVRVQLTNLVIYSDATTDFYNPTPNGIPNCELRDQHSAVDPIVGAENYDIGFAFGVGGNIGCAWYVACKNDKYRGAALININNPPGNATGVIAHEMGHQFDARHTFSGSACPPIEYNAQAAYEPGSGTTIMSYSGICNEDLDGDGNLDVAEDRNGNGILDNDNVQGGNNGQYYHAISFMEVVDYVTGLVDGTVLPDNESCGTESLVANFPPVVDAGNDYIIPRNTPFALTGSATDPDTDPLQYVWEQFDQGSPARLIDSANLANGPIFRSIIPAPSADAPEHMRTFPLLANILNGTQTAGEVLPTVNRTMNFRLTARDGIGGVSSDDMVVSVIGSPFFVTSPNGGETIGAGCFEPVNWIPGGGNLTIEVDLLISTDGGQNFDPLLAQTPNDGTQVTQFICEASGQARLKAAASDNIFFDISDDDFTIVQVPPQAAITEAIGGEVDDACFFNVSFQASVTDDCGILAGDVDVNIEQLAGLATVGALNLNKVQNNATSVSVSGNFDVSDIKLDANMNPATFRINLSATDGCGLNSTDSNTVTVIDTIPPTINATLDPNELWPPNHTMVDISATVEVMDNCPMPSFVLSSVESNEADNDIADGNTTDDIQDADINSPDIQLKLRAERAGNLTGRVYTVTYTATDASKNTALASDVVLVPKNQSN